MADVATTREMLDKILEGTVDGTLNDNLHWYAEDGVHEIPFATPPIPSRIEGRANIQAFMNPPGRPAMINYEGIRDLQVYETVDPEVIIAEYTAYGKIAATGDPFELPNIMVLKVVDGEIKLTRVFFSPAKLAPVAKG